MGDYFWGVIMVAAILGALSIVSECSVKEAHYRCLQEGQDCN